MSAGKLRLWAATGAIAVAFPCADVLSQTVGGGPPAPVSPLVTPAPPATTAVPQTPPAPSPAAPADSTPASALPEETQSRVTLPARAVSAVQVGDLGTLEGPVAGTLDNGNGGLGPAVWQGSNRAAVVAGLQAVPSATPSAAYRLLIRKLLLTAAPPPPGQANVSFNQLRLTKLLEGGYVGDAADLALRVQAPMNFDIVRTQTDALLYGARDMESCGNVTAHRLDSADSFWVELRAYCYALSGDTGPLELTRAVIMAQGIADPAFVILLDGMTSGKAVAPATLRYPDSIHIVMMSRLKLPMTAEVANVGMPASLLVAASVTTPRAIRVAAAEKAFRAGVLPSAVLAEILDSANFSPQELMGAPALARAEPLMAALARIRAALKIAPTDEARAELVYTAFEIAEREGLLAQAAALFADDAAALMPTTAWANWSDLMLRGLLLADRAESAQRWFDILDRNAPGMADTVDQLELSLALAAPNARRITGARRLLDVMAETLRPPPAPMVVQMTGDVLPDPSMPDQAAPPPPPPPPPPPKPPQAFLARATLDLGLYDALGELMQTNGRTAVEPLLAENYPGRRPPAALMQRIDKAALSDARGEVVLGALEALGRQGAGDLAPDVVVHLVRALQTAGIHDAAHALAMEAMLLRPRAGALAAR